MFVFPHQYTKYTQNTYMYINSNTYIFNLLNFKYTFFFFYLHIITIKQNKNNQPNNNYSFPPIPFSQFGSSCNFQTA